MRFHHVLFWEFPCPAWAVVSCSSGPQAGETVRKLYLLYRVVHMVDRGQPFVDIEIRVAL